MNLFASERIEPSAIKFPKGFDKLEWTVAKSYGEFCKLAENNNILNVVIDSASKSESIALRCAIALVEITCDKHTKLPTLMIVGNNAAVKKSVEEHIAKSKRWIDINRGK